MGFEYSVLTILSFSRMGYFHDKNAAPQVIVRCLKQCFTRLKMQRFSRITILPLVRHKKALGHRRMTALTHIHHLCYAKVYPR